MAQLLSRQATYKAYELSLTSADYKQFMYCNCCLSRQVMYKAYELSMTSADYKQFMYFCLSQIFSLWKSSCFLLELEKPTASVTPLCFLANLCCSDFALTGCGQDKFDCCQSFDASIPAAHENFVLHLTRTSSPSAYHPDTSRDN